MNFLRQVASWEVAQWRAPMDNSGTPKWWFPALGNSLKWTVFSSLSSESMALQHDISIYRILCSFWKFWQSVSRLCSSTRYSSELVSFQLSLRAQICLSHFSSCSWISLSFSFEIKFSIFINLFFLAFSSGHSVIRFVVHGDSCKRIHLPPLIAVAMNSTAFFDNDWQ